MGLSQHMGSESGEVDSNITLILLFESPCLPASFVLQKWMENENERIKELQLQ